MIEKRTLHQIGWWVTLAGIILYGFTDVAFLSGVVFTTGVLLAAVNAEMYPQRKTEVLALLGKTGLRESACCVLTVVLISLRC